MAIWNLSLRGIGFSIAAASNIVTEQNILFNNLLNLKDKDIEVIYQSIRKIGREIRCRNTRIPNPGIKISALAEKHLKLTYYLVQ